MSLSLAAYTSIQEALLSQTQKHLESTALIEANRDRESVRLSYADFLIESQKIASHLQASGIQAGDSVAILMTNQWKWLAAATGIFISGGVCVPLDYKQDPETQLALLKHSGAKLLVTEYPIYHKLLPLLSQEQTRALDALVADVPVTWKSEASITRFEALKEGVFEVRARTRKDVACLVYSSGTSGHPKGCMLTHGNYLSQAQALAKLYPIHPGERYFSFLPTNHAIDFMCGYLLPFFSGATVVHQRTLRPEFLASTIRRYKITHMAIVPILLKTFANKVRAGLSEKPTVLRMLFNFLIWINRNLTQGKPNHWLSATLLSRVHEKFGGNLRLMFAGGSFVDPQDARFFTDLGLPVVIGYGLTEAGTVLTVNRLDNLKPDTVGPPVDGVDLIISQPNSEGIGEVWVKGPTVMAGYKDDAELTEEAFDNGWLKTGDLGRLNDEGHLTILGRKKNMIVTEGGKNVYPEEVESAFEDVDGIEEFAVIPSSALSLESDLSQNTLILVARMKEGFERDQLETHLKLANSRLQPFKRYAQLHWISEPFPRTASMKIKRTDLSAMVQKHMSEAMRDQMAS